MQAIANDTQPATFENTIIALERSGKLLNKVSSAFFNILNAEADDEMMEISQRISPKLSESSNNIFLNEKLFARVKNVYEQKDRLNLSTEDTKLLEETFESFSVRGANLNPEDKEKYRKLSTDLSVLSLRFDQNALKDKNRYELLLTDEKDLSGLPESICEAAALRAKEKGKKGWLFNLTAPSYIPFMRYADSRKLRETMYREYMSVGNKGDEYDNKEIIRQIINIRLEIARLMGYNTYAEYSLKHTMAKNPATVYNLLNQLLDAYKPVAINEYNAVQGFAMGMEKENITVMPWDWSYYSEKLKDIRFNVNDEMTRPYFELNNVKNGVFGLATQLYGITFKENKEIPVYHPEVDAYEVYDADGKFLSILYTDFHPRDGKQSGACTNVYRDFVELPSQLMENWLTEKEFLDQIAVHYETGEKIPQELIRKLVDASNFNTGYFCCRQLSFGMLDMAWHTQNEPFEGDVIAFEKQAWARTVIVPEVAGTFMSSSFGHIFSGGYAAGYYGYKWAEVLDADAFSVFKATGIFNRETARSFRENVLSKGGTEDPAILYKRFRGQEPTIDALLIRNGIKQTEPKANSN